MKLPVSMRTEDSGKSKRLTRRYFINLASFMQPRSSLEDPRYDIPQITALFWPCKVGAGIMVAGGG